jgi:hypothetical protein
MSSKAWRGFLGIKIKEYSLLRLKRYFSQLLLKKTSNNLPEGTKARLEAVSTEVVNFKILTQ